MADSTSTPVDPSANQISPEELATVRDAAQAWSTVPPARVQTGAAFINPDLTALETAGSRPGERYVRVVRSSRHQFEQVEPGWIQATTRASAPTSLWSRFMRLLRVAIIGTPLASRQLAHERLTKIKALAVLSSDALSSVAYATEQILIILILAGSAALTYSVPIMFAILALLTAVVLSYRQTIKAYPKGGGSYIVAKDNLGPLAGLIAGSALMTDYVLTVAVSVASGLDAVVSAFPVVATHRVLMCIGIIVFIAFTNLRGIRQSGNIFAIPTYLFIAAMLLMITTVCFKLATGTAATAAPHFVAATENLTIFLILRAFASGCTALTGIEAISDGVPAFKVPEWRNARTTLTVMGILLAVMFTGITLSTHALGLQAFTSNDPHYQTVISQIAHIAFGNGGGYLFVIATTTVILVLAANTSFSDFPRLFYFLARDNYAPHQFKRLGDRLAYSNGILVLATLASILIVVFQGDVSRLIPLYTIGVFLAFTMSQAGMVSRWWRRREAGWKHGLPLNALGMLMTGVVFIITASTKFTEGAWVVIVIIPTLVSIFLAIHRHYNQLSTQMTTETPTSPINMKPVCIVPIVDLNAVALQSLAMARTISDSVIAVHISDNEDDIKELRAKWELWGNHVPLEIIESPYRSLVRPLVSYIDAIDRQRSDDTLVVLLPELAATRWWHRLLHTQSALWLRRALLMRPGTVVVSVPYHLQQHPHRLRRRTKQKAL